MTNQTNEEINVKGKHPPRITEVLQPLGGYIYYPSNAPIVQMAEKNGEAGREYLSLAEHQEIVAGLKEELKIQDDANEILTRYVAEKDKAIAELTNQKNSYKEKWEAAWKRIEGFLAELEIADGNLADCERNLEETIHDFDAAESKRARAMVALKKIAKKKPHAVSRAEAADMACEFYIVASRAIAEINSDTPDMADKVAEIPRAIKKSLLELWEENKHKPFDAICDDGVKFRCASMAPNNMAIGWDQKGRAEILGGLTRAWFFDQATT